MEKKVHKPVDHSKLGKVLQENGNSVNFLTPGEFSTLPPDPHADFEPAPEINGDERLDSFSRRSSTFMQRPSMIDEKKPIN